LFLQAMALEASMGLAGEFGAALMGFIGGERLLPPVRVARRAFCNAAPKKLKQKAAL